ncbi:hypothetical protein PPGU19_061890 (plasmid) [Paraburkholderia sp. PGU19]|uniref:hypothetical protein n=1 Tax=Paraburkholderia sp. PGU19 TaxID=2735434 RepID=UPI0015DA8C20|nr:hypothetical protein [Paraburkholderia sp. PGU19]BCG01621.1 hypothetical protein PPGU19_061890 [Paraburkholderia sp. PGU19]
MTIHRTLHEDVFATFARACQEGEFELAEHLLHAIETIARQKQDCGELDRAYLLLTHFTNRPHSAHSGRMRSFSKH